MKKILLLLLCAVFAWANPLGPCDKNADQFNRSYCDLATKADKILMGRVVSADSLSSEKIPLDYAPYSQWTYDNYLKNLEEGETVQLKLKINLESELSKNKWKKTSRKITLDVTEIRGTYWNDVQGSAYLNPNHINYIAPMNWDNSLRVFFLKKTAHGDSLLGFSSPFENGQKDVLFKTSKCGISEPISTVKDDPALDNFKALFRKSHPGYKTLFDGCYMAREERFCDSYDLYDISENSLYGMSHAEVVYGKVQSVSVTECTSDYNINDLKDGLVTMLNDSLAKLFSKAIEKTRPYDVVYQVEVTQTFDGTWKKVKPFVVELHSIQDEGYLPAGPTLALSKIDSLMDSNRIFHYYSHGNNGFELSFVSKPEKSPQKNKHRDHFARQMRNYCIVRNYAPEVKAPEVKVDRSGNDSLKIQVTNVGDSPICYHVPSDVDSYVEKDNLFFIPKYQKSMAHMEGRPFGYNCLRPQTENALKQEYSAEHKLKSPADLKKLAHIWLTWGTPEEFKSLQDIGPRDYKKECEYLNSLRKVKTSF